jgi:mxaJ protein
MPGPIRRRSAGVAVAAAVLLAAAPLPAGAATEALRVCADPNNLPFSNERGEGFENKLAELAAQALGREVSYTWWAQRRGFFRHTLNAGLCDVVLGVPARFELAETTRPYYRSTYVFAYRADRRLDLRSLKDPRLRKLKIGVQLVGDDGVNTPPAQALAREGIVRNVVGYTLYGDYREPNPPARLVEAVERGDIDVAAVWGPLAGYFAQRSPVTLTLVPIADAAAFAPLLFEFDIAMGVRKGDHATKQRLDEFIVREQQQIDRLLESYGVPLARPVEPR